MSSIIEASNIEASINERTNDQIVDRLMSYRSCTPWGYPVAIVTPLGYVAYPHGVYSYPAGYHRVYTRGGIHSKLSANSPMRMGFVTYNKSYGQNRRPLDEGRQCSQS